MLNRIIGLILLLITGCSSFPEEPPSVLRWRKSSVGINVGSIQKLEQVLWLAQEKSRHLDPSPIWTSVLENEIDLDQVDIEEIWRESLFGTQWRLENRNLDDGKLLRARLSFAISEARPQVGEDINVIAVGDVKTEAILSGVYSAGLEKEYVDDLGTRIVRAIVEHLNQLLAEAAKEAGARADILEVDETIGR